MTSHIWNLSSKNSTPSFSQKSKDRSMEWIPTSVSTKSSLTAVSREAILIVQSGWKLISMISSWELTRTLRDMFNGSILKFQTPKTQKKLWDSILQTCARTNQLMKGYLLKPIPGHATLCEKVRSRMAARRIKYRSNSRTAKISQTEFLSCSWRESIAPQLFQKIKFLNQFST